ncbi:probable methyltransferase-like protein 15 homolog [Cylas formicarius]|uniref:probable methyltransferase-like protein 15 homolog n=1 Tax=Cylas formicarius TaxID=197179 RepID=UPI002958CCE0|nr:probable methyltransferase-like protein 15 homolog [Cylas formicarius]
MKLSKIVFNVFQNFSTAAQNIMIKPAHIPVMVNEVLHYLKPETDQIILDMTFGSGGHSKKILEHAPNVKILALDRDPHAYEYALKLATQFPGQIVPLLGKFSDLPELLAEQSFGKCSLDGILFDFGCSSMQFDLPQRGFSISKNGPLDMRMDGNRIPDAPTAADVLSKATEIDIYRIIKYYGEEKQARKIARSIVEARYLFKALTSTEELADLVETVVDGVSKFNPVVDKKIHVATKTFQALRIFVNNELNEINYGMLLAHHYLKIGGRVVTITFHSLEDMIVKRHLSGNLIANSANPIPLKFSSYNLFMDSNIINQVLELNWNMLHKNVIVPSFDEIDSNSRSRSSKLRAAIKIK